MNRCIVVVPTYNEIENIGLLVPQILEQDERFEVLVIDDDSPDGTGKEADTLCKRHPGRVHVLHRQQKEGLGPDVQSIRYIESKAKKSAGSR